MKKRTTKNRRIKVVVTVLAALCLAEGFFLYRAYWGAGDTMRMVQKIRKIERTIDKYYKGDIDEEKQEEYTYRGLIAGLGDQYSDYYTAEEYEQLTQSSNGVYSGVGITMTQDSENGEIRVVNTVKGSPADGSGLKKDDVLIKINGKALKSDDQLDDVVQKIKGKEGTKVTLTFQRGDTSKDYTFTRKSIENPTVETKMAADGIGYLSISEFDEVTVDQFEEGVEELKEKGAKSLIIDLRDNPGGLLSAVVDIADDILPKGKIVYTKDKNGNTKYYNAEDDDELGMPLCVLVNGDSASASEILAGAVKDRDAGTLIGEKTFGKGIVQGFFGLGDGSYVKLTYSSYYTPSGKNIHKKGITPDITVKDDEDTKADEQLQRAIEELKKE